MAIAASVMTLIELQIIVGWLLGVAGATALGTSWGGGAGGACGFVAAFAGPPLLILVVGCIWERLDRRFRLSPDGDPPCPCGADGGQLAFERSEDHGYLMRCACGSAFVRRRGRVLQLRAGALRPHMQWQRLHGWRPSRGAQLKAPYR